MQRPNLLFVLADQWRSSAFGFRGQDPVRTPNLDALAADSAVLTNAVSNYPVCSPYRAMLMSGQYPFRNGVPLNVNSLTAPLGVGLRSDLTCWSDVLHADGYYLGYVGKWHLDPPTDDDAIYGEGVREGCVWDAYTPPERRHGFDFWYSHGCCDDHLHPHYWADAAPREAPTRVDAWSPEHETDVALGFLRDAARRYHEDGAPFALTMSYNPPHQPFDTVPSRYLDEYLDRDLLVRPNVPAGSDEAATVAAQYFAAMTGVDEQIGRLLDALSTEGLDDNTIVVFTSDHGMQLGSHALMFKNVWYDESLLVPFILRWPGRVPAGADDLLLSAPDVGPTLLGLLGSDVPAEMQGRNLSAALRGEAADRPTRALYLRPAGGFEDTTEDTRGLRTHDRTFVVQRTGDGERVYLYDLTEDPYQQTNVAADRPDEVAALTAELHEELTRCADPWK
ncbi:sulfatase-like hydrolase/transferase [Kribbella sp. NPDC051137]|uniref:sulfatase-like hydrolase/transferase n=1 Tax=Kribbella sp. NPDC051137 TaxID=3155045 RepID=UPI002F896B11